MITDVIKGKDKCISWVFSLLLAMNITFGKDIYFYNGTYIFLKNSHLFLKDAVLTLILVPVIFLFVELIIVRAVSGIRHKSIKRTIKADGKSFMLIWAGIFACWFPAFLAYYPGMLSYDAKRQTKMALGIVEYTRHHPPLHTFIWQMCIRLGDITGVTGLAIYSISQMIIVSCVMACLLYFMLKEKTHFLFWVLSFCFIALNPVMAIMSLEMTKDIYFTAVFTILVLLLYRIVKEPVDFFSFRKTGIPIIIVSVLSGLLRNNMIYVLFLSFLFMILFRKGLRKQLLFISVLSICGILLVNGPVYDSLNIKPGNPREALCVPMQQIACVSVLRDQDLDDSRKERINRFLPYEKLHDLYNPRFADPVKSEFNTDYYITHKGEFVKLWLQLLKEYPVEYIDAFTVLNIPYWYLGASSVDPYSNRRYIETRLKKRDYYPVGRRSKSKTLLAYYEKFAKYTLFKDRPVVFSLPFSISVPIWLVILSVTLLIRQKRSRYVLCLLPYILLWLTYILGPVSNFRYIYPIYIAYPFVLFIAMYCDCELPESSSGQ